MRKKGEEGREGIAKLTREVLPRRPGRATVPEPDPDHRRSDTRKWSPGPSWKHCDVVQAVLVTPLTRRLNHAAAGRLSASAQPVCPRPGHSGTRRAPAVRLGTDRVSAADGEPESHCAAAAPGAAGQCSETRSPMVRDAGRCNSHGGCSPSGSLRERWAGLSPACTASATELTVSDRISTGGRGEALTL
eukprot:767469-Hanusia_phi.AAC.1